MGLASDIKRARARVDDLAKRGQARVELERERRYVVALGFTIFDHSRQTAASVLAGALAFRLFLTLLPLTLVSVVGLGLLKEVGATPSDAVRQFGIKGVIASTINHSSSFHDPGRTVVLLLGLLALFSGARTSVATIRAIHALAWKIPVVRWRKRGRAAMLFLGSVVVGFALGGLATRARTDAGVVVGFGASVGMAAVGTAIWLAVSLLLPHREGITWTALIPGAAVVGIGFAALQAVTANWIGPRLSHESALYGSLGVSFVVLGWLYVVGRLLVAAPLLNAAMLEHRSARLAAVAKSSEAPDRGADHKSELGDDALGVDCVMSACRAVQFRGPSAACSRAPREPPLSHSRTRPSDGSVRSVVGRSTTTIRSCRADRRQRPAPAARHGKGRERLGLLLRWSYGSAFGLFHGFFTAGYPSRGQARSSAAR